MTPVEANEFFSRAFKTFPGVLEWLNEKSEDPKYTLGSWKRTLEKVTIEEANWVLSGWEDGSIPQPPVGYRRELFAIDLKACVIRDRDERNRERRREEQWIKSNRGKYIPSAAFRSIAKPFMEMLEHKSRLVDGEMTHAEYDRLVDEITEGAFS